MHQKRGVNHIDINDDEYRLNPAPFKRICTMERKVVNGEAVQLYSRLDAESTQWTITHNAWKAYFEDHKPRNKSNNTLIHRAWDKSSSDMQQKRQELIDDIRSITGVEHDYRICVQFEIRATMKSLPADPRDCSNTVLEAIGRILNKTIDRQVDSMDIDKESPTKLDRRTDKSKSHPRPQQESKRKSTPNKDDPESPKSKFSSIDIRMTSPEPSFFDEQVDKKREQKENADRELIEAERRRVETRHLEYLRMFKYLEERIRGMKIRKED